MLLGLSCEFASSLSANKMQSILHKEIIIKSFIKFAHENKKKQLTSAAAKVGTLPHIMDSKPHLNLIRDFLRERPSFHSLSAILTAQPVHLNRSIKRALSFLIK